MANLRTKDFNFEEARVIFVKGREITLKYRNGRLTKHFLLPHIKQRQVPKGSTVEALVEKHIQFTMGVHLPVIGVIADDIDKYRKLELYFNEEVDHVKGKLYSRPKKSKKR